MEGLERGRRPIRFMFETLEKEVQQLLTEEPLDLEKIKIKFEHFNECCASLAKHDALIKAWMIQNDTAEDVENKEYGELLKYKERAALIRVAVERSGIRPTQESSVSTDAVLSSAASIVGEARSRNFKLPMVQIPKFKGELKEWLRFWDQFKKIDEDDQLDGGDKFFYLLQALEPGTDAHDIVSVYPQNSENYPKATKALKERFGNPDLLLQVYIRKLLSLVIANASSKEKTPIKKLYIQLDSHLKSLESLNLESADPSTWIYPLVESSLPENILLNWKQKLAACSDEGEGTRLSRLMKFMKIQVEIGQEMEVTKSFTAGTSKAFKTDKNHDVSRRFTTTIRRRSVPTTPLLHNAELLPCVFCDRTNHEPQNCFVAKRMPLEEKRRILQEKRRCFNYCGKHFSSRCVTEGLKCQLCGFPHYTILCSGKRNLNNSTTPPPKRFRSSQPSKQTSSYANAEFSTAVALQTAMAEIINGSQKRLIRVFFDGGSQRSYVLKSTVEKMKLDSKGFETVVHSVFGGKQSPPVTHKKYDVIIQRLFTENPIQIEVRDQSVICSKIVNVPEICKILQEELNRRQLQISDFGYGSAPIDLLIGADYYGHFMTGNKVKLDCGMVALETILGWTVMGKLSDESSSNSVSTYLNMSIADATITQLWDLETLGIKDPVEVSSAYERQENIKKKFSEKVKRTEDGRYTVRLPWKDGHPPLPSYKDVCRKQMEKSYERLQKIEMASEYGRIFNDWKAENFIEDEFDRTKPGHYVPHRPVIKRESKTTPVRPVFNASFKIGNSPSLNECLHKGSNYVQRIPEILYRFRERKVGFVSDIRKAFQMIEVNREDRDATRFLWRDDTGKVLEFRHSRVMFGATCSPFILGAVLEHFLSGVEGNRREIARKLLESFYVDNSVASVDTVDQYLNFKSTAIKLMQEIGMELRMWYSSSEKIKVDENVIAVLGMNWDLERDELFLKVGEIEQPEVVTKKVVLSCVQKIFDVIGIASPAVLPMKLLLQRAWINKLGWNQPLPDEEERSFRTWLEDMKELEKIRIPRVSTGGNSNKENWTFHVFCDASQVAYGSVVFLRTTGENGVSVQLMDSKAKVAPLKKTTIPRLELLGSFVGARLAKHVQSGLKLEENVRKIYWSDSSMALSWIKRNEEWGTFVFNRVKEIRKTTEVSSWRHVPGSLNPADVVSRGCTPRDLLESRWWEGPNWLKLDEKDWPQSKPEIKEEEIVSEKKKSSIPITSTMTVMDEFRRDYSFKSQIRIIGWIGRFFFNCRMKSTGNRRSGLLSGAELKEAEFFIIKSIQMDHFPEADRKSLKGLDVILDDYGILRVKTRLTYREDTEGFKYPALLPGNDSTVRRLIADTHRSYCHAGAGFLVTKLREKYWILHSRKSVKSVISKCVKCRKLNAKPVIPATAPLPLERVKDSTVFQTTGVDLFGPLNLKNGKKIWVTIFTCAVYRAVHFEIVHSISSAAFVSALKRFIARFRRPDVIHCDNGTNFRGADKLFKTLDWKEIQKYESIKPIFFQFSPPNSSWWGGYWERLIRSTKDLMKRTIGNGSCTLKELEYLLQAITDVMNGRPLTYISENPNDLEPLTPNHFLHPWGNVRFPEAELTEAQKFRFRHQYVKTVQAELKMRFRKEYLAMLVSRSPKKASGAVKEGDIVFVGSDNRKRTTWPLGKILKLLPGKDGVSRVAEVKTEGGVFIRSLQNLYPLELDDRLPKKLKRKFPLRLEVVGLSVHRIGM